MFMFASSPPDNHMFAGRVAGHLGEQKHNFQVCLSDINMLDGILSHDVSCARYRCETGYRLPSGRHYQPYTKKKSDDAQEHLGERSSKLHQLLLKTVFFFSHPPSPTQKPSQVLNG